MIINKPVVKGKMDVKFPARVEVQDTLTLSKENGTYTFGMKNTAVAPGSYTSADITVDAQGRVTAAASGRVGREILSTNRTYYVRKDGGDSNNGLADSAGGAFLTIGKAISVVYTIDAGGFDVTIQVRAGTYNENLVLDRVVVGGKNNGRCFIIGDVTTPSNVVINGLAGTTITAIGAGTDWRINGVKITNSGGIGINGHALGWVRLGKVEIGSCGAGGLLVLADHRGTVEFMEDFIISASSTVACDAQDGGYILAAGPLTVTISGSPTFAVFARAQDQSLQKWISTTFSGSATGIKAFSDASVINSGGSTFPGDSAGVAANGGQLL